MIWVLGDATVVAVLATGTEGTAGGGGVKPTDDNGGAAGPIAVAEGWLRGEGVGAAGDGEDGLEVAAGGEDCADGDDAHPDRGDEVGGIGRW